MLIITRRPGEAIIIQLPNGEQITVAVLGVQGNLVRIDTEAPDDVSILRLFMSAFRLEVQIH